MSSFDNITREKMEKQNPNWPQIPDHSYKILITEASGSRKTKALFNLISHQSDIDKIYLYAKNPYKTKYQLLINKQEGLKRYNDSNAAIE